MPRYYFVGIMLPDLHLENAPEITFDQFDQLLKDNLSPRDYRQTEPLRRYYDIENLRCLWKGEPLLPYGNFDEHHLEEAMLNAGCFPSYIDNFLEEYGSREARLKFFPALIAKYYQQEILQAHGFVRNYLDFERNLRLIQTAFRAKKLNRNLQQELQYEDPEESFLQHLFAQMEAKQFELPEDFASLKAILEQNYGTPIDLHRALCEYRFLKVAQLAGEHAFSLDRILVALVQLIIAESWHKLNRDAGNKLIDQYIKEQA